MKWSYDKKNKEWYTLETAAYANDGYSIKKFHPHNKTYSLCNNFRRIADVRKLSSAKLIAFLINNG